MNMKNVSKSKRFLGLLFSCSLFCIQLFELVVFLRIEESIRSFFNTTFHIPESILSSFNQDIIAWRGQHRQHRSHRWMTFLSLDSLNESPFFGTVLHNKFFMEKLGKGKEYILTLLMKSESNPCSTVIDSTLISTILTMEVSKLRKKEQKTCFHQKLFRWWKIF